MRCILFLFLSVAVRADTSAPDKAPACHSPSWRGIERAFSVWCKAHPGSGIHGSCNDWLQAFRKCNGDFEPAQPGWRIVIRLFDCHDPVVEAVPEGKSWRVKDVKMKSYLPTPPILMPRPGGGGDLELDPSPSPAKRD